MKQKLSLLPIFFVLLCQGRIEAAADGVAQDYREFMRYALALAWQFRESLSKIKNQVVPTLVISGVGD